MFGQSARGNYSRKRLFVNRKEVERPQVYQQAVLLDRFAEAIRSGKSEFETSGVMGLRDIRIVEAVYRSAGAAGGHPGLRGSRRGADGRRKAIMARMIFCSSVRREDHAVLSRNGNENTRTN